MDKEKPPFELVVLNPPVVYGPIRHSIDSIDDLNTSNQHLYKTFMSSSKTAAVPKDNVHVCIDVRVSRNPASQRQSLTMLYQDLAVAHYLAAFAPNVGNRRYFVTRESNTNQEICDILRETLPERDEKIPLGTSGNYTLAPGMFRVDNSSSKEILGLTYRPFKETIADSARCFLELEKKLGPGSQSPPVTA
jgi:nucleoside-diphosphate-sugar epimerase